MVKNHIVTKCSIEQLPQIKMHHIEVKVPRNIQIIKARVPLKKAIIKVTAIRNRVHIEEIYQIDFKFKHLVEHQIEIINKIMGTGLINVIFQIRIKLYTHKIILIKIQVSIKGRALIHTKVKALVLIKEITLIIM